MKSCVRTCSRYETRANQNDEEILIDTNSSLETMVKIANALESDVSISPTTRNGKSVPQRRHRRARQRDSARKRFTDPLITNHRSPSCLVRRNH
jgi:hypothetical protein